jgi:hypothetical protein
VIGFRDEGMNPLDQVKARGCDYPDPPVYSDPRGGFMCRCIVCGRCGKHTGNTSQGHYWAFCEVTKTMRESHHCCPDNCALEEE